MRFAFALFLACTPCVAWAGASLSVAYGGSSPPLTPGAKFAPRMSDAQIAPIDTFLEPELRSAASIARWTLSNDGDSVLRPPALRAPFDPGTSSFRLGGSVDLTPKSSAGSGGLDVALVPSFEYRATPLATSFGGGAQLRLGRFSDSLRGGDPQGWYFFAGADGQQLTFDMDETGPIRPTSLAVRYAEQATVGDFQAGLSANRLGGQMGLSYVRREVNYQGPNIRGERAERVEQFGALTFTMRR